MYGTKLCRRGSSVRCAEHLSPPSGALLSHARGRRGGGRSQGGRRGGAVVDGALGRVPRLVARTMRLCQRRHERLHRRRHASPLRLGFFLSSGERAGLSDNRRDELPDECRAAVARPHVRGHSHDMDRRLPPRHATQLRCLWLPFVRAGAALARASSAAAAEAAATRVVWQALRYGHMRALRWHAVPSRCPSAVVVRL